jgi:HSP20 family protein
MDWFSRYVIDWELSNLLDTEFCIKDKERRFHKKASYNYSYRIALPSQIDENSPDASYKDGVMHVSFPKLKESKGKSIPVKNG